MSAQAARHRFRSNHSMKKPGSYIKNWLFVSPRTGFSLSQTTGVELHLERMSRPGRTNCSYSGVCFLPTRTLTDQQVMRRKKSFVSGGILAHFFFVIVECEMCECMHIQEETAGLVNSACQVLWCSLLGRAEQKKK